MVAAISVQHYMFKVTKADQQISKIGISKVRKQL